MITTMSFAVTKALVVVGLAASLALAPVHPADADPAVAPPTAKVLIDLVTVNGSGCPRDSAMVDISPDNTRLRLMFSRYLAQVGVGATRVDFRKNCQVSMSLHVPTGYTYAIIGTTYYGFAHLEAGASATVRGNYYLQGDPATTLAQHSLNGPFSDGWGFEDTLDLAYLRWAPCGEQRYLNVNTELRVSAGTSDTTTTTSYITMDGIDIEASAVYHLIWMRCPATA